MKILAIDAATEACSVALLINDDVLGRFELAPQQHSQKLLPFVDQVLAEGQVSLSELDGIAFGQGPGSFTGVRIGVSITQGLAFAHDLPVVGVSNLAMMAQQAIVEMEAKEVVAAIDARMAEVYLASYKNNDGLAELVGTETVIKPELITVEHNVNYAQAAAVGTGWQTYEAQLTKSLGCQLTDINLPNARFMLPIAVNAFKNGLGKSAEFAQPNYVRDEVSWKKLPGR